MTAQLSRQQIDANRETGSNQRSSSNIIDRAIVARTH
jgi:hypothetical protein